MGVVVAPGAVALVEVGRPGVGVVGVAGEVDDGAAQLFVDGPAECDDLTLPDWRVEGAAPARQVSASGVGNRPRASPISARSRAARTVPDRGREVKMAASGWSASWWAICWSRVLIWPRIAVSAATQAGVIYARAAPSVPDVPRGASWRWLHSRSRLDWWL